MLMLILLNYYIFIEIMRYLHDNKWFGNQLNVFYDPLLRLKKAKRAFLITLRYIVLFL